jgi:NTE family protein
MDITLALGGGGAKGNSHIGVLRRLEKEGYRIRSVAGTSYGGLVGVLYAMGHSPQEIQTAFEAVDQNHLYNRDVLDGPSLLGLGGVRKLIDQMLGEKTFDDLRIPCAVTAVDINAGSEVILSSGRLKDAILATIAWDFSDPTFGQLGIDRWRRAQPCSCFRGADVVPKPACCCRGTERPNG